MKLIVDQSEKHTENKLILQCRTLTNDLKRLLEHIRSFSLTLNGHKDGADFSLALEQIFYIEAVDSHTFIYSQNDVYETGERLYEIENRLADTDFLRISKSCIVNLDHMVSVRPLPNHRFEASLDNGEAVIISRHYVADLKNKLGI